MLLNVNSTDYEVEADEGELLVSVIHEKVGLKNTRFGCGMQICGACKVLIEGEVARSCVVKIGDVKGKKIKTSEALPDLPDM